MKYFLILIFVTTNFAFANCAGQVVQSNPLNAEGYGFIPIDLFELFEPISGHPIPSGGQVQLCIDESVNNCDETMVIGVQTFSRICKRKCAKFNCQPFVSIFGNGECKNDSNDFNEDGLLCTAKGSVDLTCQCVDEILIP